jgi:tetratricopeptide (TPR) repeat protein
MRARRDLLLAGVSLAVAMLLAAIAIAAIWAAKPAGSANVVNQSGSGIASGGNTVVNAPVNIGLDEKQVEQRVAEAQKPLAGQLEELAKQVARDKGVEVAPLRAILVKMGEVGVRDEDIPKRLSEKADELIKLREEIARLRRGPAELASFAAQAETLINKGDLDGARIVLAAGRTTARSLREQSSRYEADFLAQEAKVDHLQLAYRDAATKYAEAAGLVAALDRRKQWEFVLAQAEELLSQGDELGDNPALAEAINVYRESLLLAPRSERPLDWATTQNDLGIALRTLGERESGTARLEEAVVAFRDVLEERTGERVPLQRAETQNSLGVALWRLGERESGTARLEEAVAAYRDALKEYSRERVPLQWAATQNNLGLALWRLGERESGTARLEEAVASYRDALKEYTRERVPLQWAATQNNLGIALRTLGERESGTARLEEAVAAYRDALKENTRERVPLDWAMTQTNLGSALQRLGERESGTARLEEAVAAYRGALKEFTRERVPFYWATTQSNLGVALQTLGERESGAVRLEEAVAAYSDALKERTRERAPLQWATTSGNQGVALMHLAERTKDAATAKMAVQQIEDALEVMHTGTYGPGAAYYEARLPEARRIRDALKAP